MVILTFFLNFGKYIFIKWLMTSDFRGKDESSIRPILEKSGSESTHNTTDRIRTRKSVREAAKNTVLFLVTRPLRGRGMGH